MATEIEANEAKREAAEKKYIKDRDEALRQAERIAEAAEDACKISKPMSWAARKAQNKLFAALKKDSKFGPGVTGKTETEARVEAPPGSVRSPHEDNLSMIPGPPSDKDFASLSAFPLKPDSNSKVDAIEFPLQYDKSAVEPDVRISVEDCIE